jgi:putative ABC transport system ATP-binding protein
MVFQSYALYPHMSVYENMSFALKLAKADPAVIEEKVARAAQILNLTDYLKRTPKELSGGQRQRVAIARALVTRPSIILADEPTGNLDSKTGVEIMALFEQLYEQGNTIIVVTHEEDIARHARRIVRLRDGLIESDLAAD